MLVSPATADGQIPHIAPVLFERLPMLNEHTPFAVKNADVYRNVVTTFGDGLSALHRQSELLSVLVIQISKLRHDIILRFWHFRG